MSANISVGISDWKIAAPPSVLVTYALGSCIGICMYDKTKPLAGLSHIMLPDSTAAGAGAINRMKFADTAIPDMYAAMLKQGARAANLTAKIAGGALMFAANSDRFNIGERNVVAVVAALQKLHVPIIAKDTGLNYGRTVFFFPTDGKVEVKSTTQGVKVI
ncbi:putative chemoreceptor glutamine deamidase CheD [Clostridia bacterium]|nr:putative chemoreceptor glutamine deamidase CheD [Clostridia bacterium]